MFFPSKVKINIKIINNKTKLYIKYTYISKVCKTSLNGLSNDFKILK